MIIALFLLLPALAMAGPVNPLRPRACNADNCLRAIEASAFPTRAGTSDCSSFLRTTVTPATSTITATLSFSVTSTVTSDVTISTVVPVTTTDTVDVTSTAVLDVTFTTVILVTTTDTVGATTTSFVTVTVTPALRKRQVTIVPSSIPTYASACSGAVRYSSACSCLGVTATIITAPTPLTTETISTTFTPIETAVATVLTDSITSVANTAFATITDATVTETITVLTDSITSAASTVTITTTDATETTTTTATATPVCGVNLVVNGDFPEPTYAPFVETSTGAAQPQFNGGCGTDPFCPLYYIPGSGSETLTQTINTYPGETYTLSYKLANFGAGGVSAFSCSVDATGALPVVANLADVSDTTFVTYSGTFIATGSSTVLTCQGTTTSFLAVNIEAIHIEC